MYEDAHLEASYEDRFLVFDDFLSDLDNFDQERDYEEEEYWRNHEDEDEDDLI